MGFIKKKTFASLLWRFPPFILVKWNYKNSAASSAEISLQSTTSGHASQLYITSEDKNKIYQEMYVKRPH